MFQISKEFAFSASHRLEHLPPEHQCSRLHGHNYVVRVLLRSDRLDSDGFVLDYGRLAPLKAYIDEQLDHRHLNTVLGENVTAERMAWHLLDTITRERMVPSDVDVAVEVSETPKTWAGCYPPGWFR